MAKIISYSKIDDFLSKIHRQKKTIVLVGGCFDIIHIGHIEFLNLSKKCGVSLFVLLESDEKLKQLKGENRPLFPQEIRAKVLASLSMVDYVLLIPYFRFDKDYTSLIKKIKPHVIAITQHDPLLQIKQKQAQMVQAQFVIIPYKKTFSTSHLSHILGID